MQNLQNKLYFIKMKKLLKEKGKYSDRFQKQIRSKGIVDGVVFNVMFEYMGLDKDFDAIEAVFPIVYVQGDSRLDYLPETQVCIRRYGVIEEIYKYNGDTVPDRYRTFMNDYNQTKQHLIQKNRESRSNQVRSYKKKFRTNNIVYSMRGKQNE